MFRKTTAVMFIAVMAMLIALKHPVLGYCLCLDSYIAGDCVCEVEKPATDSASHDSSCNTCCSETESHNDPASSPCDDCTQHLMVDVGDFVWQVSDKIPSDTETLLPPHDFDLRSVQLPLASLHTTAPARGDPSPGLTGRTPIYLRHSVLRL